MTSRQLLELAMRLQLRQSQVQSRTLEEFAKAIKELGKGEVGDGHAHMRRQPRTRTYAAPTPCDTLIRLCRKHPPKTKGKVRI